MCYRDAVFDLLVRRMRIGLLKPLRERLREKVSRDSWIRSGSRRLQSGRKKLQWIYRDPLARLFYYLLPGSVLRDPRYFRLWERKGIHVVRAHYASPIPETDKLPDSTWTRRSECVGVEWNESAQIHLLQTFRSEYRAEYDQLPFEPSPTPHQFSFAQTTFGPIDAEVLYCMIRHFKPKRILEIGSGHSTLLAAQAVRANQEKDGHACKLVAIEPFPKKILKRGFLGLARLIPQPVQSVPLSEFTTLAPNDILFIDSSHVLKTGSDVQYEFLEILPRLQPGVLIHIHDILLPEEYSKTWILEESSFFTEQYLLQALLTFTRHFEILFAARYLCLHHPEELEKAFRSISRLPGLGGGSFWMRKVG